MITQLQVSVRSNATTVLAKIHPQVVVEYNLLGWEEGEELKHLYTNYWSVKYLKGRNMVGWYLVESATNGRRYQADERNLYPIVSTLNHYIVAEQYTSNPLHNPVHKIHTNCYSTIAIITQLDSTQHYTNTFNKLFASVCPKLWDLEVHFHMQRSAWNAHITHQHSQRQQGLGTGQWETINTLSMLPSTTLPLARGHNSTVPLPAAVRVPKYIPLLFTT